MALIGPAAANTVVNEVRAVGLWMAQNGGLERLTRAYPSVGPANPTVASIEESFVFDVENYFTKPTLPRPPEVIDSVEFTADYVRAVTQWDRFLQNVIDHAENCRIPLQRAEELLGIVLQQHP